MMSNHSPAAPGWRFYLPFAIADAILLIAAWIIFSQASRPMVGYEVAGFGGCIALGALLGSWPFVLRHRVELKLLETSELSNCLSQIQNVQKIAERIGQATSQWQNVQESSQKSVQSAREIADRMTKETKDFLAFMEKANDSERNNLRLEVDKLRRVEGDWLQVVVRLMDHVYALHAAAVRSGQPGLAEQIGHFQGACRDVVRRVGLVQLVVPPGTPFDSTQHHLADPEAVAPTGAVVVDTFATGLTFQGQLVRPPLVIVRPPGEPSPAQAPADGFAHSTSFSSLGEELSPAPTSVAAPAPEEADTSSLSVSDIARRHAEAGGEAATGEPPSTPDQQDLFGTSQGGA